MTEDVHARNKTFLSSAENAFAVKKDLIQKLDGMGLQVLNVDVDYPLLETGEEQDCTAEVLIRLPLPRRHR